MKSTLHPLIPHFENCSNAFLKLRSSATEVIQSMTPTFFFLPYRTSFAISSAGMTFNRLSGPLTLQPSSSITYCSLFLDAKSM